MLTVNDYLLQYQRKLPKMLFLWLMIGSFITVFVLIIIKKEGCMVLDYIILFILICILAVLIWILKKSNSNNQGLLRLSEFENKIGQFDTSFRDEFSRNRNELDSKLISFSSMVDTKLSELSDSLLKSSSDMRLEVGNALKDFAENV